MEKRLPKAPMALKGAQLSLQETEDEGLIQYFPSSTQGWWTFHFGIETDQKMRPRPSFTPVVVYSTGSMCTEAFTQPAFSFKLLFLFIEREKKHETRQKSFSGLGCQDHIQHFTYQPQFSSWFLSH